MEDVFRRHSQGTQRAQPTSNRSAKTEEGKPQGAAKLSQGGFSGSFKTRGAAKAEGENDFCKNHLGCGSFSQTMVVEQEHQQQLHEGEHPQHKDEADVPGLWGH